MKRTQLKRTPFKRSTTRLPCRRAKPRPADDTPLYKRYGAENDCSELAFYLGLSFELRNGKFVRFELGKKTILDGSHFYADGRPVRLERHHLWSYHQRNDVTSNLILATDDEHKWLGANGPAGRVLCVYSKMLKRVALGNRTEFDLAEMKAVTGKHIPGWLASLTEFGGELSWMRPLHREAIQLAKRIEIADQETGAA